MIWFALLWLLTFAVAFALGFLCCVHFVFKFETMGEVADLLKPLDGETKK